MDDHRLPRYSDAGLSARDLFFVTGYSVQFFVEDQDKENFYEALFAKLFRNIGHFKVFPLGGKDAVLRHASTSGAGPIKRVYVVDKDFDDLHDSIVKDPRVFYTDDYCVESALIEEDALVQFAVEESPTIRREEVRRRLAFHANASLWLVQLDRLFRAFFLVQKYEIDKRNCDLSIFHFSVKDKPWLLDESKIKAYEDEVAQACVDLGVIRSCVLYEDVSRRAFGSAKVGRKHISGKFLQDLFQAYLRHVNLLRGSVRRESVSMRLVAPSKLTRMRLFRARVNQYLSEVG